MRRCPAIALALGAVLGCDGPTATHAPAIAVASSGDGQEGPVGGLLAAPLEITVTDAGGAPTGGVPVRWRAQHNSRVIAADRFTSDAGLAHARFALGSQVGPAEASAEVPGLPLVTFNLFARTPAELPYGVVIPISIATFDGSGQVVHPDFAGHGGAGFAFPRHLAITPYPGGDARKELPSVFGGTGPTAWLLEEGAPNPVIASPSSGYMSDPDLVYVSERDELWMYYRHVTDQNVIRLVRSGDGRRWSIPVTVVAASNHRIVSPSIVRRSPDDWMMWSINSGSAGCSVAAATLELRRSTDGINWSAPQPLALAHGQLTPWHVDVQWLPDLGEFWALYNAKTPGGCATPAVFLATSTDGVVWNPRPGPVLAKGAHPPFADIVYRSTFQYDAAADEVTLWYSGAAYDGRSYVWAAAVERRRRADLFEGLEASDPVPAFAPAPAELVDWP